MSKIITCSAPGKIHLMGEHAVVYGKPAILAAISKRLSVTIKTNNSNQIIIQSSTEKQKEKTSYSKILLQYKKSLDLLKKVQQKNDTKLLQQITASSSLDLAKLTIGEIISELKLSKLPGMEISINSNIPIGAGLGSSAALSVSITKTFLKFFSDKNDNFDAINQIAYNIEKFQHGFPSGGDNTAISYGGFTWFRKETENLRIIQPLGISSPQTISDNFILINSGKPTETTGEMVSKVRKIKEKNPQQFDKILNQQENITKQIYTSIHSRDIENFKKAIQMGERNLEKIRVVSVKTQKIIKSIEDIEGVAKICGAGGFKENSGIILAFHQDINQIIKIAQNQNLDFFQVTLGEEGVRIDHEQL